MVNRKMQHASTLRLLEKIEQKESLGAAYVPTPGIEVGVSEVQLWRFAGLFSERVLENLEFGADESSNRRGLGIFVRRTGCAFSS